jgi:hypothetical protein
MKFKEDRPFANPEVAEQELLELGANAMEADHAGLLAVEIINRQFRDAGSSYEEYSAAKVTRSTRPARTSWVEDSD